MPVGWGNPKDATNTVATRPAHVNTGVGERRWHRNGSGSELGTQDNAEDHNAVLAALRDVFDYFGISDSEGDDTLLRQAILKSGDRGEVTGTNMASAATVDIGSSPGMRVRITGTTTITSFGATANRLRLVQFAGALTLTHNGSTLQLPGEANITTVNGDRLIAVSNGIGEWQVLAYTRLSGEPVVALGGPKFIARWDYSTPVSSVDFINLAQYTTLVAVLIGVSHSGGSNAALEVRLSTNNGSTYAAGTTTLSGALPASSLNNGRVEMLDLKTATRKTIVNATTGDPGVTTSFRFGESTLAEAHNAIRFAFASNPNFDAGSIVLFGA